MSAFDASSAVVKCPAGVVCFDAAGGTLMGLGGGEVLQVPTVGGKAMAPHTGARGRARPTLGASDAAPSVGAGGAILVVGSADTTAVHIAGTVSVDGRSGALVGGDGGGGGGGSGGSLHVIARHVTLDGCHLSADGGAGGGNASSVDTMTGGGSGGRIQIMHWGMSAGSPSTWSARGGAAG